MNCGGKICLYKRKRGKYTTRTPILRLKINEKLFHCRYNNFYSITNALNIEEQLPVWYVMDEVGSAIQHSDEPNFRMVPFIHTKTQMTYSIIFPVKDLCSGNIVSRDFAEGVPEHSRDAHLLPWTGRSFSNINFDHIEVGHDYFLGGHVEETLPVIENIKTGVKKPKYKVFSEYSLTREFLTSDRFEIVHNEDDADILWLTKHFKMFRELDPTKFVNQFPFEYVITIKDLLCITCRRISGNSVRCQPPWLPITYNLKTELPQFISYYQHREEMGLNNHWIVKPFNLARGLDTHITDNINYVIRVSNTGPKIVQKYIEDPVLFHRPEIGGKVKFDVRYVILLKSVRPLEVYVYKNFFLRFANQPFEMANFGVYEKHFTVMNYTEEAVLKHMLYEEFLVDWAVQYPEVSWGSVENNIFHMVRQVFECATIESPPCGIAHSPQSRALYAADIMLEWSAPGQVQPKILEINWTPDCKRACDYYNNFYNDIFGLLFLNEDNDVFVKI